MLDAAEVAQGEMTSLITTSEKTEFPHFFGGHENPTFSAKNEESAPQST